MTHIYAFDHPHQPHADLRTLLGGKGAGLAEMTTILGLRVPAGFTITTETCNDYLATGWPEGLDDEIEHHIGRLERFLGRRFGDPDDPLLVSVRSGAPVSMPGMMDTILNVGLHDAAVDGLAEVAGDRAFADDCRRRLEEMFRSTVGEADLPEDPRGSYGPRSRPCSDRGTASGPVHIGPRSRSTTTSVPP